MKDCLLSPYGEVIFCGGAWNHNTDAEKILIERYGYNDALEIYEKHEFENATDVLMGYGWVRYSTCANRGWCFNKYKITTEQKNKIFELTGDNII